MNEIKKYTLENGVRILVEPLPYVGSAAIGLWCTTGSSQERDSEAGITHFIEHMLFKGTEKRTSRQIAEEIEGRGGILNAFTDKENTCYYCRVLDDDVETGIDVLSDMVCNSQLDDSELQKEKGVVLEEIKRSEDEPGDHVHDLHLQGRWPNHPLGKPVIGTPESVSAFSRNDLVHYIERRYSGSTLVLSVAGNVEPERVKEWAEARLGHLPKESAAETFERPVSTATKREVAKDVEQVHFCIGSDGPAYPEDKRHDYTVLDAVLGGGMSSRLFQNIREKHGMVYAIGSYTLTYSKAGALTVYGGTSPQHWEDIQALVRKELDALMETGATDGELERVRKNIAGHIVLAMEGTNTRMMRMARNEINFGRMVPVSETLEKIRAVTNDDLIQAARTCFAPEKISTTAIGPF